MRPFSRRRRAPKASYVQPPFWSVNAPIWSTPPGDREQIENSFEGYVQGAYKRNGVVFACILARLLVFSEARFQWRRFDRGRPSELFGDQNLSLLERPWPNGTTGELLARMEQDASLAGNFYATTVGEEGQQRIRRLRPDWVTIVTGSRSGGGPFAIDAEPVAYLYAPKGNQAPPPTLLLRDQVAHFSPIPDPEAQWRGMSWITPLLGEIEADSSATKHKKKFLENGAIPGVVITHAPDIGEAEFEAFVKQFREEHEGSANAYKTLHLGGGADAKVLGTDLQQLDFKNTQGAGETRIAAAAGVHPVIVGLSEGLAGSSLNAGNFGAARRRFADGTIRPLWRMAAASLATLVTAPDAGARLWYDDRDVPFLREDAKEEAVIRKENASTIEMLVRAGFTAASAVTAVVNGDFRVLEHTGLFSVQLQAPGSEDPAVPTQETAK